MTVPDNIDGHGRDPVGLLPPASSAASSSPSLDALLPKAMLDRAVDIGVAKAQLPLVRLATLGVLGGAFIALGAMFFTAVTTGGSSFGSTRLLGGVVFSLGLVLVVVGGAELFTGNNLLTIAFAERRISLAKLARNWGVVYVANAAGAIGTALLVLLADHHRTGSAAVGVRMLTIAETKAALSGRTAFFSGVLANVLVCLAVWLCYAGRSVADRVVAIVLPISAFVTAGFEHSIANMYFLAIGWLVREHAPSAFWREAERLASDYEHLDGAGIATNLAAATLGNLVGGAVLVGLVYWLAYGRWRKG